MRRHGTRGLERATATMRAGLEDAARCLDPQGLEGLGSIAEAARGAVAEYDAARAALEAEGGGGRMSRGGPNGIRPRAVLLAIGWAPLLLLLAMMLRGGGRRE